METKVKYRSMVISKYNKLKACNFFTKKLEKAFCYAFCEIFKKT